VLEYFLGTGGFKDLQTYSIRGLPRPHDDKYFPELLFSDPVYAVWERKQLEVASKPQIMFESKASRRLKTERTCKYVSISTRGTTQLSDIRWGFETTSKNFHSGDQEMGRTILVSIFWLVLTVIIIALDRQNYSYAMVTGPSRSYLWILSKRRTLDESIYAKLVSQADAWGFDTGQLIRVEHNLPDEGMRLLENTMKTDTRENAKMITSCPSAPNCVSSIDTDRKHFIEPLRFAGSAKDAQHRLLEVLLSLKRTRVVTFKENYIHAESVSAIMRFVDDVEFFFDDRQKVIHVKSASRVGYSDLGVNRRRIEKIRKLFNERNNNGHDQ